MDKEFEDRIKEGLCPFCMCKQQPVMVHGHYQCPVCHVVTQDCCQGETCENTGEGSPSGD